MISDIGTSTIGTVEDVIQPADDVADQNSCDPCNRCASSLWSAQSVLTRCPNFAEAASMIGLDTTSAAEC
jgi:hypothetical protein